MDFQPAPSQGQALRGNDQWEADAGLVRWPSAVRLVGGCWDKAEELQKKNGLELPNINPSLNRREGHVGNREAAPAYGQALSLPKPGPRRVPLSAAGKENPAPQPPTTGECARIVNYSKEAV